MSDDTAPPTIESISVDSWWVTLTFSEPLDESQGGSPGRFRVENITERLISGVTVRTRSRIELEGGQIRPVGRTVTLMTRYPFPSWFNENSLHVEVSYNRPGSGGIQDLNGNRTRSFSRHRADILTNNRSPTLLQATLNGDEIDLDYNWALNRGGAGPHARAFSVRRPDGAAVAVTAVSVAGGSVTLTLASAARYRESGWRVSYDPSRTTRPLLYGQTNVRSFSGIELLNHTPAKLAPALESAVWHDNWIRLTYDQDVKAVAPPAKAYTVSANRAVFKVKSTSVFNELVVLRLLSAVPASVDSCGLRVSYDPPSSNAVTGKASERAAPALDAEPVKRLRLGEGKGDPCDGLSVADAQGTEGRDSAITFTVGLRPAPTGRVTVRYATSDGTARQGSDYTSTRGTLTFEAGETTKTVDVPIIDDGVEDDGETFTFTLSNASGASIADGTATGTIRNTEIVPTVTGVELVADASGDRRWGPGETIEARFTFSEAVMVTGGSPWLEVSVDGFTQPMLLAYASGTGSRTLAFSMEVPEGVTPFSGLAVVANSLVVGSARIISKTGVAADLAHDGTEPSAAPEAVTDNPLTAEFLDAPASHGNARFEIRLRFGEELKLSYLTLRDKALRVTGGKLNGVRRATRGSDREWYVVVTPGRRVNEVTVTLPARTCAEAGAVCTADKRGLAADVTVTVPRTPPRTSPGVRPFEVELGNVPEEHDGESEIVFEVAFNKRPNGNYSYTHFRDSVFRISRGGTRLTLGAARLNKRHNDRWRVKVSPGGKEDVRVRIGPFSSCSDPGAVCTSDGEVLANEIDKTIQGPPGLSVADATAQEGPGVTVDFAVTLSRASTSTVTVAYATADGSAKAGSDYTETSGTLTFAAGVTEQTVSVPVLDDSHDEESETFTLTLSNPSGGNAYITDATATGTIENHDPMPKAWLTRFGRTVASQAVDAIGARFEGGGGSHVTVAGMRLNASGQPVSAGDDTLSIADGFESLKWNNETGHTRSMSAKELLLGSSFHLGTGGENGTPAWAGWGRVSTGGFEADVDGTRLDGIVTSGFLGADVGRDRWLAGIAVSFSEGDGDYRLMHPDHDDSGSVESSLTTFYPYTKVGVSEKVDFWGLAGIGSGELTLTQAPTRTTEAVYETDISMRMGAVGMRGQVVSPEASGGLGVAVKSDAFWVSTESEAVTNAHGNLAAAEGEASRARLLVEAQRPFEAGAGTLTPSAEVGVRYDGGDAETGTGIEVGGALRYQGAGITIEGAVRTLVAHEESGYEEWGASGSVRVQPGASGRGLSLTFSPTWGAAASGVEKLWGLRDAQGLTNDSDFEAQARMEAEVGYGVGVPHSRSLVTPYAGLSVAEGGSRTLRTGTRWKLSDEATIGIEATRDQGTDQRGTSAVRFRAATRW